MKKTLVRVIALALVTVMLVCALASCSKTLSGEYSAEVEILGQKASVTYKFSGNDVEVTTKTTILGQVNTETEEATYEIVENEDGTMEITFSVEEDGEIKTNTVTFEEGEDYIKLGGIQYNKK
jgi:uncharacterized lipoprotein YehR (DUF1307 family)